MHGKQTWNKGSGQEYNNMILRPTLMHTKTLYENGPNPFFSGFFNLMGTRIVQIRMAKSV